MHSHRYWKRALLLPCRILARSPGVVAADLVRLTDGHFAALTQFLLGSPAVPEYLYMWYHLSGYPAAMFYIKKFIVRLVRLISEIKPLC